MPRRTLDDTLRQLSAAVDNLTAELAVVRSSSTEIAAAMASLGGTVSEMSAVQAGLVGWNAEIRTRVRRTQALTARAYEALHDWPGLLAAARDQPSYGLAYEDPEPLISIPIPTYHSPDTLCERALASVFAQTYRNWEAIVVGDHCTDDTEQRIRALGDGRVSFHNLAARENDPADPYEAYAVKGSVPRTTGIQLSRGRWIAPLSQDDAWDSDHLTTLLTCAREQRVEVVYSRQRAVGDAPDYPVLRSVGAWPPRYGDFVWQSAVFHANLRFLGYDRVCALASEPNDWNLARRAWEAGVRFHFLDRETGTLFNQAGRLAELTAAYASLGLPIEASAMP
jgi:hypothetical protein